MVSVDSGQDELENRLKLFVYVMREDTETVRAVMKRNVEGKRRRAL